MRMQGHGSRRCVAQRRAADYHPPTPAPVPSAMPVEDARIKRKLNNRGKYGERVTISQRPDRPGKVEARWILGGRRRRCIVPDVTLTQRAGSWRANTQTTEELGFLAEVLQDRLHRGEPMPGETGCASWAHLWEEARARKDRRSPPEPEQPLPARFTVRQVFERLLGPSYAAERTAKGRIDLARARKRAGGQNSGLVAATWTKEARDARRIADELEEILGPDARWAPSLETFDAVRNTLIARAAKAGARSPRRAIRKMQLYLHVVGLAPKRLDKSLAPRHNLELGQWQAEARRAWEQRGRQLRPPARPRYSSGETAALYREARLGDHDPRLGLLFELGMEGRPAQILRASRSNIVDGEPEHPHGRFEGPGSGRKHGLVYAFTAAHRAAVNHYLRYGYLRECERAYQAGEITDYPLFPSGVRTASDVVVPHAKLRPVNYRQLLGDPSDGEDAAPTAFYGIERAAGIERRVGRGFYGLKRAMADLAPNSATRLGITDQAAVSLATAHDLAGTSTIYRREIREDPNVLRSVGAIVWESRRALRDELLESEKRRQIAGYDVEHFAISAVAPLDDHAILELSSGHLVRLPYRVLEGERPGMLEIMIRTLPTVRGDWSLDAAGRSIRWPRMRAPLTLDEIVARANANATFDPSEIAYVPGEPADGAADRGWEAALDEAIDEALEEELREREAASDGAE